LKTFGAQDWTVAVKATPATEFVMPVADTAAVEEVKVTPERVTMTVLKPATVTGVKLIT